MGIQASQHRPALCARRMVREGGSPPPERGSFLDSLCGRLRDRGGPRRRRPADPGGLAQADEQVRLDGPPREDARGPVPSGRRGRLRTRGPELHWPPDIRLLGLHPLLGTKPTRRMGGQAQDGEGPTQASAGRAGGVVPGEPMHLPIGDQHQKLTQKLEGHYGYYGIIGNYASLQKFLGAARGIWKRWLSRRGRDKPLSWPEFVRLEQHYRLPPARVVHGLLSGAAKS